MAYISTSKMLLAQEFPFLVILMDYIIRSCDPQGSVDIVNVDLNHAKPNLT